jgi:hypothetical protein
MTNKALEGWELSKEFDGFERTDQKGAILRVQPTHWSGGLNKNKPGESTNYEFTPVVADTPEEGMEMVDDWIEQGVN